MSTLLCCLEMCGDMSGGHDDDEKGVCVCARTFHFLEGKAPSHTVKGLFYPECWWHLQWKTIKLFGHVSVLSDASLIVDQIFNMQSLCGFLDAVWHYLCAGKVNKWLKASYWMTLVLRQSWYSPVGFYFAASLFLVAKCWQVMTSG